MRVRQGAPDLQACLQIHVLRLLTICSAVMSAGLCEW